MEWTCGGGSRGGKGREALLANKPQPTRFKKKKKKKTADMYV